MAEANFGSVRRWFDEDWNQRRLRFQVGQSGSNGPVPDVIYMATAPRRKEPTITSG